jgi:intron-binding protein aquarius
LEKSGDWISNLLKYFLTTLYYIPQVGDGKCGECIIDHVIIKLIDGSLVSLDVIRFAERCFEFMIDLESQLPTRRFFNGLIADQQIGILCSLAPFMKREEQDVQLLQKLLTMLKFYSGFEVNDHTGLALTRNDITQAHCDRLVSLQHVAFQQFKKSLPDLPLANLASIEKRDNLMKHFAPLSDKDLGKLCEALHLRTSLVVDKATLKEAGVETREVLLETLIATFEKRESQIDVINSTPLYPNEVCSNDGY